MMFSNLIGNPIAKDILMRLIASKKIPHAFLLTGPSGIGKKKFAMELAKGIMGPEHIRKIDSGNHPDLRIFSPEGKSGMHPVVSIHQLQDQMALKPFEADSRVFIIDDADRMLATSSNALLKTLEEPEDRNYIILITSQAEDVIPTIHSRCRTIPFFSINEKDLYQLIKERSDKPDPEAKRLAFLSHGSIGKALSLVESTLDPKRDLLIEILSSSSFNAVHLASPIQKLDQLISVKTDEDSDSTKYYLEVDSLFEEIYYWYRDLHLLRLGVSPDFVFHLDHLNLLQEKDKSSLPSLEKVGKLLEECRLAIHRSIKLKTVLEYLFSQIS
jgi:DNA polymerase III subunit delta'